MRTKHALTSSITAAVLLLTGSMPSFAQPLPEDRSFNRLIERATCDLSGGELPYPFSVTGYPFSVDRLARALAANGPEVSEINVAIFDNDFVGYRVEVTNDGEMQMKPSRNFPKPFFSTRNVFNPYFDRDRGPLAPVQYPVVDAKIGHGTSVAGIILGGKYDDNMEPEESTSSLAKPSVRRLLTYDPLKPVVSDGSKEKSWLRLAFVPVDYASSGRSSDPIAELENFFAGTGGSVKVDIINMSFGQEITDNRNITLSGAVRGPLIVAAAGNNKREVPGANFRAKPISADDNGIMLVVASHNADGALSNFSNFGDSVTLAAPGCAIHSWIDGDGEAQPLSGTSMAAAMTSFAAALVNSKWGLQANIGMSLRNRLISSARYNSLLSKCGLATGDIECVEFGGMLDPEAAVLVYRDYIEYRACGSDLKGQGCAPRMAIGTLLRTPASLGRCVEAEFLQPRPRYSGRSGMTLNGAIKHISGSEYKIFYETGTKVGLGEIAAKSCNLAQTLEETIAFQPQGEQLDGSTATEPIEIPVSQVMRVVARAEAAPN